MINLRDLFNHTGTKKQCIEAAKSRINTEFDPAFIFRISARKFGLAFGSNLFRIQGYELVRKFTD